MYLFGSPTRFRVPVDGYRESFNRKAFFAQVRPGTRLTLTVEKAQLAKPDRPPSDPVDTVFVYGLKDDRMEYCSVSARKDWEAKNRLYGLGLAIFFTLAGVGLAVLYVKTATNVESPSAPLDAAPAGPSVVRNDRLPDAVSREPKPPE